MDIAFCALGDDWLTIKNILNEVGGLAIIRQVEDNTFVASTDLGIFSDGFYFLWAVESGCFSVKSLDGSFSQVRDPFVPWSSSHVCGDENVPMIAPVSYPKLIHFDIKGCNQHNTQPVPISHFGWSGNRDNQLLREEISISSQTKWKKLRTIIKKHAIPRIFELQGAPYPAKILCFQNAEKIYRS